MSDNPETICAECEYCVIVRSCPLLPGCALSAVRDNVSGVNSYRLCRLENEGGRCSKFTPKRTIRRRVLDLFSRRKERGTT